MGATCFVAFRRQPHFVEAVQRHDDVELDVIGKEVGEYQGLLRLTKAAECQVDENRPDCDIIGPVGEMRQQLAGQTPGDVGSHRTTDQPNDHGISTTRGGSESTRAQGRWRHVQIGRPRTDHSVEGMQLPATDCVPSVPLYGT